MHLDIKFCLLFQVEQLRKMEMLSGIMQAIHLLVRGKDFWPQGFIPPPNRIINLEINIPK